MVLDEPTSGLDPLLQRQFAALVAERTAEGVTVLLSSHVMAEVEQIAQRVALLPGWIPLVALNGPVQFNLPVANLTAASAQMGLMCLGRSMAAQAVAAWTVRRAVGLAAVAGYVVISYVVYGLSGTVGWLAHLRPLTVWRWAQLTTRYRGDSAGTSHSPRARGRHLRMGRNVPLCSSRPARVIIRAFVGAGGSVPGAGHASIVDACSKSA